MRLRRIHGVVPDFRVWSLAVQYQPASRIWVLDAYLGRHLHRVVISRG